LKISAASLAFAKRPSFVEKKYCAMDNKEIRSLRILEEENPKLKQLVADLSLDKKLLQYVLSKKL
jgi:putative transposase